MTSPNPLAGRVAVVTGVSRRIGIGAAIVDRLVADGARVMAAGWTSHDEDQPWGVDPIDDGAWDPAFVARMDADFADPDAPGAVIDAAVERFGAVDIVVANHARSSAGGLSEVTVDELDASWAVNARASVLLAQEFERARQPERPGGRVVLFTSGQHLGPMPGELAYVVSKGAIHQMTASLADHFGGQGVTVNTVNPGPVDTGYATGADHAAVAERFPGGSWGTPDDVARVVGWLVSDDAAWVTGQIINAEGGFRRG
ncbi:MAG: SDR family oxidoreductase [Actinomycetota bacterium]